MQDQDYELMGRALQLAAEANHLVYPNPKVGAVIWRDGQLLAEGYHRRCGTEHAEVVALNELARRNLTARDATIYVNLEPCSHWGKTPPCCEALVRAEVGRVVVGHRDPNRQVDGGGFDYLRRHGIQVDVGVREAEARQLNAAFIKHMQVALPLVTAIWSEHPQLLGTSPNGSSPALNPDCRQHLARLRWEADAAVLITPNTEISEQAYFDLSPRLSELVNLASGADYRPQLTSLLKPERTHVILEARRVAPSTGLSASSIDRLVCVAASRRVRQVEIGRLIAEAGLIAEHEAAEAAQYSVVEYGDQAVITGWLQTW